MTDAFGGYGGIAQYNRDLADAIASLPEIDRLVVLPRTMPFVRESNVARLGTSSFNFWCSSAAQIHHPRQLIEHGSKAPNEVATLLNVSRVTLWRALQA